MSSRVIEDAENLIRHSNSPHNLKEGLRKLLDAYIMLWDAHDTALTRITDLELDLEWRDIE
jgi:hypothetical protein